MFKFVSSKFNYNNLRNSFITKCDSNIDDDDINIDLDDEVCFIYDIYKLHVILLIFSFFLFMIYIYIHSYIHT